MATTLHPTQMVQLQSFWNLIQTIDESVQKELFMLLKHKYAETSKDIKRDSPSFLQMQGILKRSNQQKSDQEMLDEYLDEKYGL